ncbi:MULTISPECIES: hypothetical protein [Peribacillus]|uniref:hypothetical protein n=1 Tax=Peribacillus TaxID=2675229 RepID=UPI0038693CF1
MTGEGHENTVYELSGKPMTQEELTSALGDGLVKEVHVQQVDDIAYANMMNGAGVPEAYLPMLVKYVKRYSKWWVRDREQRFKKITRSLFYTNK